MGRDKARLPLGGVSFAARVARPLTQVAYPVFAVGGGAGTGLRVVRDPREGPLAALAAGWRALRRFQPRPFAVLVVACDLPLLSDAPLVHVYQAWQDSIAGAVVPVVAGRPQPLAACFSWSACDKAVALADEGARSMKDLLAAIDVRYEPMDAYARDLWDVDTPDDYNDAKRILDGPE